MMYYLALFLAAFSCTWAQTTLFPTIVEIIQQAAPTQAYPNTAGKSNEFLVTVDAHSSTPGDVVITNQIMTLFGFQGIPPGATDCYLFANLPENYPILQYAEYEAYADYGDGPTYSQNPQLVFRGLDISTFSSAGSWTWDSIVNGGHIHNIGPQGGYNALFYNNWRDAVITGQECPGVTGPYGGAVGYAVSMPDEYSTGLVFMNQQYVYGNLSETAGVYMTYIF